MTHHAVLGFKHQGASLRASLLVEVSLSKKVSHKITHFARPQNWEFRSGTGKHQGRMVPHRCNIAGQKVGARHFQQVDIAFGCAAAKGMTRFAPSFNRDTALFGISWLDYRGWG